MTEVEQILKLVADRDAWRAKAEKLEAVLAKVNDYAERVWCSRPGINDHALTFLVHTLQEHYKPEGRQK